MGADAADERTSASSVEPRWVAVFDSIHYVLAAEKEFKERAVWCDLVPTPRKISSDCGMALEFRASDLDTVREILADPPLRANGVYRPTADGYQAVSL